MLRIVLRAANFPQVRPHGAFAAGGVQLGCEVLLILGDLHQVLGAGLHHRCHLGETGVESELLRAEVRAACGCLAQVDAVAVFALGSRYAVGSQKHLLAGVLTALGRFGQCAGHVVNTG